MMAHRGDARGITGAAIPDFFRLQALSWPQSGYAETGLETACEWSLAKEHALIEPTSPRLVRLGNPRQHAMQYGQMEQSLLDCEGL